MHVSVKYMYSVYLSKLYKNVAFKICVKDVDKHWTEGFEILCTIIAAGTNVLEGRTNIITNQKPGNLRHTGKGAVKSSIETAHVFMIQTFWKRKGVETANHLNSFCLPEMRSMCYFSRSNRNQLNQHVAKFLYATQYSVCRLYKINIFKLILNSFQSSKVKTNFELNQTH